MKKHKALKIVLIVLAVLIVAAGAAGWWYYNNLMSKMGKIPVYSSREDKRTFEADDCDQRDDTYMPPVIESKVDLKGVESVFNADIINILLIGSDTRYVGQNGLSDTMIVCSINKLTNEIKLVSFMRDTAAKIRSSELKLNAAFAYGGAELLDGTLERNFGVVVDANVIVNFESFVAALAQVGNLEIELTAEEAFYINYNWESDYFWDLKEGVNVMNPDQVLAYARTRYVGNSDWERTSRQRKVIMAAFNKAKQLPLTQIVSLAERIMPCIATDLSPSLMVNLAKYIYTHDMHIAGELLIPIDGYSLELPDGGAALGCNYARNSRAYREFIYGY